MKYIYVFFIIVIFGFSSCQSYPDPPAGINFGWQDDQYIHDKANNKTFINYQYGYIECIGTPGNYTYRYFFGKKIDDKLNVTLVNRDIILETQRTDIERNQWEGIIERVVPANEHDNLVAKFREAYAKAYDEGVMLGLSSRGIYYVEMYGLILQDFWWGDGTFIDGITNRAYLVYNINTKEVYPVVEYAAPFVSNILTMGAPVSNVGAHSFTLWGDAVSFDKSQLFQNGFIYSESKRNFIKKGGSYDKSINAYAYAPAFVPAELGVFIERLTIGGNIYSNYQYGTIVAMPAPVGYKDRIYGGRRYSANGGLQLINDGLNHFLAVIDRATVTGTYTNSQQTAIKNALKARYTDYWKVGYSLGIPDAEVKPWDGIYCLSFFWGDSVADPFYGAPHDSRHGVAAIRVDFENTGSSPKTFLLSDIMLELWVKVVKLPFFPLGEVYPTGESQAMGKYVFQPFKGWFFDGSVKPFDGHLVVMDDNWRSFAYTQLSIKDWLAEQARLEAKTGGGGIRASVPAEQNKLRGEQLLMSVADKYFYPDSLIVNQYWNIHDKDKDANDTIADIWHYGTFLESVLYYLSVNPNSGFFKKLEKDLYEGLAYYEEYRDDDWTIYYLWYAGAPRILAKNSSQVDDNSVIAQYFIHMYRYDRTAVRAFEQAKGIMEWIIKYGWDRSINPVTGEEFGGNDQGFAARSQGAYYKPICANEIVLTDILQIAELTDNPEEKAYFMEWAHKYYDFCIDTYLLDSGMFGDYIGCVRENDVTLAHGMLATDMYTYHQGAMMEAGVRMYRATGNEKYLEQAKKTARATRDYFGRRDLIPGYWQPDYNIYHWFNLLQLRGYMMLAQVNAETRAEFDPYVQEWQKCLDYAYENYYMDGMLPTLFLQGWIYNNPFTDNLNVMDASAFAQYYFMFSMYASGMEIN